jgi:hypothetical protein
MKSVSDIRHFEDRRTPATSSTMKTFRTYTM